MPKYEPKLVTTVTTAFNTFDQDNSGKIEVREIGNVIRSLGVYPTETEIRQFVMQMQKDSASLYIQKQTFIEFMCDLISKNEFTGPTIQQLTQAFETLDPDSRGYLDENTIRVQLSSQGEKFSADEVETFIQFAKDAESGQIDWKAYVKATMELMWKQ